MAERSKAPDSRLITFHSRAFWSPHGGVGSNPTPDNGLFFTSPLRLTDIITERESWNNCAPQRLKYSLSSTNRQLLYFIRSPTNRIVQDRCNGRKSSEMLLNHRVHDSNEVALQKISLNFVEEWCVCTAFSVILGHVHSSSRAHTSTAVQSSAVAQKRAALLPARTSQPTSKPTQSVKKP